MGQTTSDLTERELDSVSSNGSAHDAPAPSVRELITELEAAGAARLNNRTIWILQILSGQPGLSNSEIAACAGQMKKGHASIMLRRLKRLGLIENAQDDPTPYVANAWRLTTLGETLVEAVQRERLSARVRPSLGSPAASSIEARALRSLNGLCEPERARVLEAAIKIADREGPRALTAERLTHSARISTEAFCELFGDVDSCLLAAVDDALGQCALGARAAHDSCSGWSERVRASLHAVLEIFDAQPMLARLLVVHAAQAGPSIQARRSEVIAQLASVLDDERAPARRFPATLTAEAVVRGALGVLEGRLATGEPGHLADLLGPLMSFIATPYLGAKAARREISSGSVVSNGAPPAREGAVAILQGASSRGIRDQRAVRTIAVVAESPGLGNADVAAIAGVRDEGQMSRLLARLARLGLIENRSEAKAAPGRRNSWFLTSSGEAFQLALERKSIRSNGVAGRSTGAVSATAPERSHARRLAVRPSLRRSCAVAACCVSRRSPRQASHLPFLPNFSTARRPLPSFNARTRSCPHS